MKTLITCLRTPLGNIAVGLLFGLIFAVVMRLAIQRVF
jgi:1,4-dihydroxy-2-naphthoate octaprenyltransferase